MKKYKSLAMLKNGVDIIAILKTASINQTSLVVINYKFVLILRVLYHCGLQYYFRIILNLLKMYLVIWFTTAK